MVHMCYMPSRPVDSIDLYMVYIYCMPTRPVDSIDRCTVAQVLATCRELSIGHHHHLVIG